MSKNRIKPFSIYYLFLNQVDLKYSIAKRSICRQAKKMQDKSAEISMGTILILRQQIDWVGGVRKMAIFADVQLIFMLM